MEKEFAENEDLNPSKDDLDIQEVDESEQSEEETTPVIDAGSIETWERLKIQAYIARSIMSLLVIYTLVGLVFFVATGIPWILASSPPLIFYPLKKLLNYYFPGK